MRIEQNILPQRRQFAAQYRSMERIRLANNDPVSLKIGQYALHRLWPDKRCPCQLRIGYTGW